MSKKRILYFFPENPCEKNAGNKMRALQLLNYFKEREMLVDLVSLKPGMSIWNDADIEALNVSGLVRHVYFLEKKPSKKNRVKYFITFKVPNFFYKRRFNSKSSLNKHISSNIKTQFETILKRSSYDYIIISYLYWADLVKTNWIRESKTIVDTHDFLTLQHIAEKDFDLGATFEDEIIKLNQFDEVWTISTDERFLFGQFCKTKVRIIPPYFAHPIIGASEIEKKYDLIYVASDNPHNILSVSWFFDQVYPRLPKNISICIIGRIGNYIKDYLNVHKLIYVEELHDFFAKSKISICPMLSGTGVKIKVVEALAYGLPVVCTSRGMDGIPNKVNNGCLVSDSPEAFAQHIISLLQNQDLYQQLSGWGKSLFHNFFTAQLVYKELDKAFHVGEIKHNVPLSLQ